MRALAPFAPARSCDVVWDVLIKARKIAAADSEAVLDRRIQDWNRGSNARDTSFRVKQLQFCGWDNLENADRLRSRICA